MRGPLVAAVAVASTAPGVAAPVLVPPAVAAPGVAGAAGVPGAAAADLGVAAPLDAPAWAPLLAAWAPVCTGLLPAYATRRAQQPRCIPGA